MKNVVIILVEFISCSKYLWNDKNKLNATFKTEISLNHLLHHLKNCLIFFSFQCSSNVKMYES